jgi:hypothetical protein
MPDLAGMPPRRQRYRPRRAMAISLTEAIDHLDELDPELTICARPPWSPHTDCVLVRADEQGAIPPEIRGDGYAVFLEVAVAQAICGPSLSRAEREALLLERARDG